MLEIRHFSKTYSGGKRAVDDLNLTVEAGSIYGFIGHNGAGKTTTLRSAAGILGFEEGDILIDGHRVKAEPAVYKRQLIILAKPAFDKGCPGACPLSARALSGIIKNNRRLFFRPSVSVAATAARNGAIKIS